MPDKINPGKNPSTSVIPTESVYFSAYSPPSHRFFGTQIKDHPDNEWELDEIEARKFLEEEEGESEEEEQNYLEPTEVVVEGGVVTGVLVDRDIFEDMEAKRKQAGDIGQCCRDVQYVVSPVLIDNERIRAKFLFKLLVLENLLHIPPFLWLIVQQYVMSIHNFIYEQWGLTALFIVVLYVILVWAVIFSDLPRHYPADNVLLFVKAAAQAQVSATVTAFMERWMVMWRLHQYDKEDPGSLVNREFALSMNDTVFTYPIMAQIYLVETSFVYIIMALYFLILKGDVKKDWMFWVAFPTQIGLVALGFFIKQSGIGANTIFFGPVEWDYVQLLFSGLAAGIWQQWRLYNLRELIGGRKMDITENECKVAALNFIF